MRYLFFDIESASGDDGGHICSLGYVLTDENLNIIDSKDLYMNPECEFDPYIEKNVLDFPASHYEAYPPFREQYDTIKKLFQDCLVVGHAVDNDAYYLFNEIDREGLPQIEYKFMDTALIYLVMNPGCYGTPSLQSLCELYNLGEQGETHQSVIDARLTMEVFKKLKELYSLDWNDPRYTGCVENNDILINGSSYFNSLDEWHNNEIYKFLLKNHPSSREGELKGKRFAVSEAYEDSHYREILYCIKKILELGGTFSRNPNTCNVFVDYNSIRKLRLVNDRLSKGASVTVMDLDYFKEMIHYKEEEVDEAVNSIEDEYYNYSDSMDYEEASTSLGSLFDDFLKK